MRWKTKILAPAAAAFAVAVLASPAFGAGFAIFEQGTKAMGMAGAFTAQADDPSALFHNAAGIAFQEEGELAIGFTYIRSLEGEFEGADPFPGEGYTAEQETLSEFPPHAYWVRPINETFTFGLGVMTPFGLTTEWDPTEFRGRFISSLASLTAIDVNPTLGWQLTPTFGLGVGAVARVSTVELRRNIPRLNPFTQTQADIATLELEGGFDNIGYGWNAGILHKVNPSFSWGLSYRSKIDVEYEGDAHLTQNLTGTPFDDLVGGALPFGTDFPVETAIDFPDLASFGVAFALSRNSLLEADVNWTGWSSFEELQIVFPEGQLPSSTIPERYEDVYNYRLGLRLGANDAPSQWRFGVVYDETPQPEGAVSPLLPDADRLGFTLGYGWQGASTSLDLAVMYLTFDERTRDENFDDDPNDPSTFFGTYNNEAVLIGATLGF
ncbi:MAG TPA: outer membrane protein transport protein [Thermoanaerobaculia bacterium]|nr:outer membrane protein transport protein [Thermoanaerobaculia bacterium]